MTYLTVKLTEDQLMYIVQCLSTTLKDLHDFTDNEQEIAFATRLRHQLVKAKIS